jgi:hypothetical protein
MPTCAFVSVSYTRRLARIHCLALISGSCVLDTLLRSSVRTASSPHSLRFHIGGNCARARHLRFVLRRTANDDDSISFENLLAQQSRRAFHSRWHDTSFVMAQIPLERSPRFAPTSRRCLSKLPAKPDVPSAKPGQSNMCQWQLRN